MGWARSIFVRALVFAALPLGCAAEAGELLVMPYRCAVINGEPRLSPSDDRGYSVVGRREEREFSACSPADPTACRRWKVYRFDVDCGGTRVPWIDVAAAARGGRAWVEGNRLKMEMPPRWGMPPDDACARSLEGGGPYGGGFRRFCADRRSFDNPPVVAMPEGFAPMMGLNGIFVADNGSRPGAGPGPDRGPETDPRYGNGPGEMARADDGGRLQWKASPVPPPRFADAQEASRSKREPVAAEPKKTATPRTATAEASNKAPARPSEESTGKSSAKATHTTDSAPAAKPEMSKLDIKPTIINSKDARDPFSDSKPAADAAADVSETASDATREGATQDTAKQEPSPAPGTGTTADADADANSPKRPDAAAPVAAAAPSAPPAASPTSPSPTQTASSEPLNQPSPPPVAAANPAPLPAEGNASVVTASISKPASSGGTTSVLPAPLDALGPGALAAAALLALTLVALTYYQMRSQPEGDFGNRDIGALSLDGRGRDLVPTLAPDAPVHREPPGPVAPGDGGMAIGTDIPATRAEALRILGMGVAADVSDAAIKKIVDGLRMSWHPDAATNEDDRRLRELRIKQINAAWEIIGGKRPG